MTTSTTTTTTTTTISTTSISAAAAAEISSTMIALEREQNNLSRNNLVQLTLEKMGLEVREAYIREFSDVWIDKVVDFNWESGHELTFVGELLIVARRCYDFRDRYEDRKPGRELLPGEKEVTWGDPHYAYYGILTAPAVSDTIAETWHLYAWSIVDEVKDIVYKEEDKKRKSWGWKTNLELSTAGCSPAEVTAWWSMNWKKEVSPEVWANLCSTCSTEQVEWAMEAHSNRYLESIDMRLGSSFPRSMDIVHALAKAKGIAKGRKLPKRQTLVGIPPTRVCKDGSMEWSF